MTDPITREQVERAIAEAQHASGFALAQAALRILGNGWLSVCPRYVAETFDVRVTLPEAYRVALTRWRDELAAAEPVRPKPAEDSPERLRERREGIPWTLAKAAMAVREVLGDEREHATGSRFLALSVEALESGAYVGDGLEECTRAYAAALSAEEARRAALAKAEPERPAPRFKVGDWVRVVSNGTVYQVGEIATPFGGDAYYYRETGGAENSWQAAALEPASPPAPEVVDVPQPIVREADAQEAWWNPRAAHVVTVRRDSRVMDVSVDLLRTMLEAIDAQQGGAS